MSESVSCGLDGRSVGADKAERGRTKACTKSSLTRERERESPDCQVREIRLILNR